MRFKNVLVDLRGQSKSFFRKKSNIFWTLAFPIFLILIFGAIFSNTGSGVITVYVQNLDEGSGSLMYLDALNSTGSLDLVMVDPGEDLDQFIKDNSVVFAMVVPANFSMAFVPESNVTAHVDLKMDETMSTAGIVRNIVSAVINHINLEASHGREFVVLDTSSIIQKRFTFLDFFVPGVIALTIMTTCVFGMQGTISRFKAAGIFRKLATTPMTPFEWLLSRMAWFLFISFVTLAVIMLFGIIVFGMTMSIGIEVVLLVIAGSAMFSALGMIIARFVKDEETASAAANAITFPMMFLSGTFFQLEMMPDYLQAIAQVLPLTYMSAGMRDAMIYDNMGGAIDNLIVTGVIAIIFVIVAVAITRWNEE